MDLTKELLDNEIASVSAKLSEVTASANKIAGALSVLQDLRKYMDKAEEVEIGGEKVELNAPTQDNTKISDENLAIQEAVDAKEALSLQQVAELVAGPGATAEEPVAIEEKD